MAFRLGLQPFTICVCGGDYRGATAEQLQVLQISRGSPVGRSYIKQSMHPFFICRLIRRPSSLGLQHHRSNRRGSPAALNGPCRGRMARRRPTGPHDMMPLLLSLIPLMTYFSVAGLAGLFISSAIATCHHSWASSAQG